MPTTPHVLLLLAKVTLVLVAALLAARALQRAAAGARHLVWLAALAALLLVPALGAWSPVRLAVLPGALAPAAPAAPNAMPNVLPNVLPTAAPIVVLRAEPAGGAPPAAPAAAGGPAPEPAGRALAAGLAALAGVGVLPALVGAWAAVALAVGLSLAASWLAVRRIVRRARPLEAPDWQAARYETADRLSLAEAPRLLRSADAPMPFACGLRRPTVVLPAECDAWAPERRQAVLLHEFAHVRRRDLAGHTLARLVCAAYWFHPLVWTAARRLRAESERACDDLALACGARPADYAEHLLDIVASARREATPAAALAMARRSEFEGRMLDILDPERTRRMPSRRRSAALVGALGAFAVLVGAAGPAPADGPAAAAAAPATPTAAEPTPTGPVATITAGRVVLQASAAPAAPRPANLAAAPAPAAGAADTLPDDEALDAGAAGERVRERVRTQVRERVTAAHTGVVAEAVAEAMAGVRADVRVTGRWQWAGAQGARSRTAPDDGRAELLARVLRADTSAALRRIAAWGLAEHADAPAAVPALAAALRGDRSAVVREMAAWALAEGEGDATGRAALTAALRTDPDAGVRATAAWALGSRDEAGAADVLVAALADAAPAVRQRAAWALGNVEPRTAPPALVARLGDAEAGVRRAAAWALYQIEDPAAAPALERALQAERDPALQRAYVRALAVLGERAMPAIRGLLDAADPQVRATAVRALAGGDAAGPWPWPWPDPRPFP